MGLAPPVAEVEAEDDLAVLVDVAGRDEAEARVEGAGSVIGHDVAGEQLGGAFAAQSSASG